jgi:hypothetical protein
MSEQPDSERQVETKFYLGNWYNEDVEIEELQRLEMVVVAVAELSDKQPDLPQEFHAEFKAVAVAAGPTYKEGASIEEFMVSPGAFQNEPEVTADEIEEEVLEEELDDDEERQHDFGTWERRPGWRDVRDESPGSCLESNPKDSDAEGGK